ncbi:MAG: hypothetical protein LBB48_04660 [Treponema sp.]|nr:hypothetical protein [Treponema sp.]
MIRPTGKIIARHVAPDKQTAGEKDLPGAASSYVYGKEYQEKHLERIEKKLRYIDRFLSTAEPRRGAGCEEVKSNITDRDSGKIKGAHGYIQGYNGMAAAEAFGSGSEYFPGMPDSLN